MEIDGKNTPINLQTAIQRIDSQTTPVSRVQKNGGEEAQPSADRIELSVRGREIQHLDEMIRAAPDVRADRVEQIRSALQSGTYNVNAEMIADKILGGDYFDATY